MSSYKHIVSAVRVSIIQAHGVRRSCVLALSLHPLSVSEHHVLAFTPEGRGIEAVHGEDVLSLSSVALSLPARYQHETEHYRTR